MEQSLSSLIHRDHWPLTDIVDSFIKIYKEDRKKAFLMLGQYFIDMSGSKGRLTPEMLSMLTYERIVMRMRDEFDNNIAHYPFKGTVEEWTGYRDDFSDFLQLLVAACRQENIIYDEYLLRETISLLASLSESPVLAFRYISTIAALKITTALVEVIYDLNESNKNLKQQLNSENQKNSETRSINRLVRLELQNDELQKKIIEISLALTRSFKSIFAIRVYDEIAEIRSACIRALGFWMKKIPNLFIRDLFLEYVSRGLHDPAASVRLTSVKALEPLYDTEQFAPKLELFSRKVKERIVAMRLDEDPKVGASAVRLVTTMQKFHRDVFTDVDCKKIHELVYSHHRLVGRAAGTFLTLRLFRLDETVARPVMRTKIGKLRSPNTPLIRDLVSFFIESDRPKLAEYLVDSLLTLNPMMKDWQCMTDLLLEEPGEGEEPLDGKKEESLIELMAHCVKQAGGGKTVLERDLQWLDDREQEMCIGDKQRATEHFAICLPELLKKYREDAKVLRHLMSLPQHLDLEMYRSSRFDAEFRTLLEIIRTIVKTSYDRQVLTEAAEIWEKVCSDTGGASVDSFERKMLSILLEEIVNEFKALLSDEFSVDRQRHPEDEENIHFIGSLRRIAIFYSEHDLNDFEIWELLQRIIDVNKFPLGAVTESMDGCFFAIHWARDRIQLKYRDNSELPIPVSYDWGHGIETEILQLRNRLESYMNLLRLMLSVDGNKTSAELSVPENAFVCICDLLVDFSKPPLGMRSKYFFSHKLVYKPDKNLQISLNRFLQEHIFSADHEQDHQQEDDKADRVENYSSMLKDYCTLFTNDVIPLDSCADVLKHFERYYDEYGDVLLMLMNMIRYRDTTKWALLLLDSLRILWNENFTPEKPILDRKSEEFLGISALADRFVNLFGRSVDKKDVREAIVAFHRSGIEFALETNWNVDLGNANPPPKLQFLEIIAPFSAKLLRQDKLLVLKHLDEQLMDRASPTCNDDWESLLLYRKSLEDDQSFPKPGAIGEAKGETIQEPDEELHRVVTLLTPESSPQSTSEEST